MILKKDGFYYENEKVEDLAYHLNEEVSIEETVTLENLFDTLIEFKDLDLLFKSWTKGFEFKEYYNDLKTESSDKETDILYLEISNVSETMSYIDDDCVKSTEFDSYVNVTGMSKDDHYSISLSDLNTLKDLPIRINDKFIIYRDFDDDPKRENPLLNAKRYISVYDFIGSILSEISFHGYSKDKEDFIGVLDERLEEYELGDVETISHEDFMLEILEKDLKRLLKEEKYERAEMIKKEIEELKNGKD